MCFWWLEKTEKFLFLCKDIKKRLFLGAVFYRVS